MLIGCVVRCGMMHEQVGKKGYVQLQTNFGNVNLEIHCDWYVTDISPSRHDLANAVLRYALTGHLGALGTS